MRRQRYLIVLIVALTACCVLAQTAFAAGPDKRHFLFTYKVMLKDVPPGELRFWIPAAPSNEQQKVRLLKVAAPVPLEREREGEYGNYLFFGKMAAPLKEVEIELQYEVTRFEEIGSLSGAGKKVSQKELARSLAPDRLVPLDDKVRKLAAELTAGKSAPLAKARAIYDYTTDNLSYDKSGTGWGRGDINYACDLKRGNCTDFHALFIGLCRASGIPARFIIGFPIPEGKKEGSIAGYHCWAEFYLEDHGWIPVDSSEASKNKAKRDYYFGNLCANRVEFTQGRDIQLDPPQVGEKLNYFIYPYFELDGKPYADLEKSFSFKEF